MIQVWPDDALERVAHKYLEQVEIDDEDKTKTIYICQYFHQSSFALSERYYQ